jgi:hypothetical protein
VDTTAENSELLQDRRKRLERLLKPPRGEAAQNIARDIVLSEALVGKGETMFWESLPHGLGSPLQAGFGKRTERDVALRRLPDEAFLLESACGFCFHGASSSIGTSPCHAGARKTETLPKSPLVLSPPPDI